MNVRTTVLSILAAGCVTAACADAPSATNELSPSASLITADAIEADVAVLSADSMEGRTPGTVGEERTTRYITERYRQIGLEPVDGEYLLPVELVGLTKEASSSSLSIEGPDGPLSLVDEENMTFWSTTEQPVEEVRDAPLVFVGYGVQAPEHDWDDFKGEDVSGKVLLFLNDDPPVEEDGEELFGGGRPHLLRPLELQVRAGGQARAAGAIVIHTTESASYGFSVIGNMGSGQVWQRTYRVPICWRGWTRPLRAGGRVHGHRPLGPLRDGRPARLPPGGHRLPRHRPHRDRYRARAGPQRGRHGPGDRPGARRGVRGLHRPSRPPGDGRGARG
jgi:hypothetical protein